MSQPDSQPLTSVPAVHSTGARVAVGLAKIGMVLRSHAWQEGFAQDLTPTQGQVLAHLERQPGLTLNQVADGLGVRASTASEAVGVLEKKGLVIKQRPLEDARRLSLSLTEAGKREAARVATWPDFLAQVVEGLSEEEQGVLLRLVQRMIRELQLRGEVPVSRMCSTCRYFRPYVHDDARNPHHCAYVNLPFGNPDLRMDCPEQDPATGAEADAAWERFAGVG